MDKRYQVFVSSTYSDLQDERRAVIQTLIEADCIPAGMELFPAADEEQFEFITRVIDDCDYYLLIIGGRYGSTTAEGISYTEKEYDYAVSKGLKVIALIHQSPDEIPFGKSEQDPALRQKLATFRDKVSTGRLVKFWKTASDLPGLVSRSMNYAIKAYPAIGWARANRAATEDILARVEALHSVNDELRRQNEELRASLPESQPVIEDLAGLDDKMTFRGTYISEFANYGKRDAWKAEPSWRDVFAYISPYLVRFPSEQSVKDVLEAALFARTNKEGRGVEMEDQDLQTAGVQLRALGLVNIKYAQSTTGGMGLFWSLTATGERLMMEVRAVKKPKAEDAAKA